MILSELSVAPASFAKLDNSDEEFGFYRRVHKPVGSPNKPVQTVLDDDNDDDDERLARRKSRLLEPHPAIAGSPHVATGGSVGGQRRADAAAPRGISQAQIGEHYGTCIRLAAENKITSRNAFNLHLIDYMSDMLKNEDYASFQIASSSLDAGAKIYAGRVDAVHQETYQVLTGLGRPDKQQAEKNDDNANGNVDDADEYGEVMGRKEQRRKGQMHREILQKNLNKIRSKGLSAKVDVDPLFQHQTASYDEGGTAELRLNQLNSLDDTSALILDSSTPVLTISTAPSAVEPLHVSGVLWEAVSQMLPNRVITNQLVLCPSLQSFRFTDWDPSKDTLESSSWNETANQGRTLSDHSETSINPNVVPMLPDDIDDDNAPCDYDDDDNDTLVGHQGTDFTEVVGSSGKEAAAVSGQSTAAVPAPDIPEKNETEGDIFVTSLKSMLNKQYEYFGQMNDNLLGMWAGPDHWRKKAKRPKLHADEGNGKDAGENEDEGDEANPESVAVGVSKRRKGVRGRKSRPVKITYTEACRPSENKTRNGNLSRADWPKNILSEGLPNTAAANATVFKEPYRQRVSRQLNQLPAEPTDSRSALYQLCNREIILESTHSNGWDSSKGDSHPAASSELCPAGMLWLDRAGGDTNGAVGLDDAVAPADVDDDADHPLDDDYDGRLDAICVEEDDDAALPFEGAFTQPVSAAFGEFQRAGDLELVSQPHQVARIEIGYARTAKMINIRRLKQAMWSHLEYSLSSSAPTAPCFPVPPPRSPVASVASTSSAPASLPDGGADAEAQNRPPSPVATACQPSVERCSFSDTLTSLSSRITWQTAKELSISISLNCLLHLCNEQSLFLENSDHFSDIYISQGLPESELEELKSSNSDGPTGQVVGCEGATKRLSRNDLPERQAKAKRLRPSTLDSWLDGSDTGSPS